ncbi:MAG: hypothetical protein NT062_00260 [Proteobacteria bacterium]|nr:hypothetical protein [Pseudomonadota bacterium]
MRYLASAIYKLNHGDTLGGATDLGHALTRGPMSAQTHEAVGKLLLETGPLDEARHAFDTAMQLDPGRALPITSELIRLNSYLGDYAAAERGLDTLQATGVPALLRLAALLRYRLLRWTNQRVASLREETATFTARFGPNIQRLFDMMAAGPVDLVLAECEMVAMFADARPRRLQLFSIQILAEEALAEHDAPLALLAVEYACRHGLVDLTWIDRCPMFTGLRLDPRWQVARELVVAQARQLHAALRAVAPA